MSTDEEAPRASSFPERATAAISRLG
ncbi:MAG: TRAP transporter small permease, partial [Mesorhizobium sp.]